MIKLVSIGLNENSQDIVCIDESGKLVLVSPDGDKTPLDLRGPSNEQQIDHKENEKLYRELMALKF